MRKLITALFLSLMISSVSAQKKVAIINLMDSTILHVHRGLTVFSNSITEFDCTLDPKLYVTGQMHRFLSGKFSLDYPDANNQPVIKPDDLPVDEIYERDTSAELNYKAWVKEHRSEYSYVIFIENKPWIEPLLNIRLESNGLLTGGINNSQWAMAYSTLFFTAYRTENLKILHFDKSLWYNTWTIKDFVFAEENSVINQEMLPVIRENLSRLIDSRIGYFLVRSGLLSQAEYYSIVQ